MTRGIVSALNRDIRDTPFDDYIQTDAAINHGNSGGALFARAWRSDRHEHRHFFAGGEQWLDWSSGFAIPSNDVKLTSP